MKVHGSCHCGHVSFEADADPEKVSVCHCADCQASTGSAFRTNVPVPGNAFRMLSGEPTIYIKTTAESGNPRAQAFCPKCGTPIYSTTPGDGPKASYMVRVGTLRERNELVPKVQNWFRSAQPWVTAIGALRKNEKGAT
ncbi:MAG: GFA family protein [Burkholderiales bacterium]